MPIRAAIGVGWVPAVIFVTAHDQFALRAFEAHALDYLLKPFDDERFGAALERARERIRQQQGGDLDRRLRALLENVREDHGYQIASSAVWAHPAITGRSIIVKDVDKVICWGF